jgi:hypothetical protein
MSAMKVGFFHSIESDLVRSARVDLFWFYGIFHSQLSKDLLNWFFGNLRYEGASNPPHGKSKERLNLCERLSMQRSNINSSIITMRLFQACQFLALPGASSEQNICAKLPNFVYRQTNDSVFRPLKPNSVISKDLGLLREVKYPIVAA